MTLSTPISDQSKILKFSLLFLVAFAYIVMAKIGLSFAFDGTNASPFWAPAGIALAAVLLAGYGVWPFIFCGAFLVNLQVLLSGGSSLQSACLISLVTGIGNTFEAVIGAYLIRRFSPGDNPPETFRGVLIFIFLGTILAALVSAITGVTVFCAVRENFTLFNQMFVIWWLGDILGILITAPVILFWRDRKYKSWDLKNYLELLLLVTALILFGYFIAYTNSPVKFLLIPLLLWSILRFGHFETFCFILLMCAFAIWVNSSHNLSSDGMQFKFFLIFQLYFTVIAITFLFLTALLKSQKSMSARISSQQKHYEELYNNSPDMFVSVSPKDTSILLCNKTLLQKTGYTAEEVIGAPIFKMYHEDCMSDVRSAFKQFRKTGSVVNKELMVKRKDGSKIDVSLNVRSVRDSDGTILSSISSWRDITEQKQAESKLLIANKELQDLNRLISTTTSNLNAKEMLDDILVEALSIVDLEAGTVCLIDGENYLELVAERGISDETRFDLSTNAVKVGECLCGDCVQEKCPLILFDRKSVLEYASRESLRHEDIRFHAAFPLISKEKALGVLCVFTRTDNKPRESSLKLLETSTHQIAMAIENAILFEKVHSHAEELEREVQIRTADLADRKNELDLLIKDLSANTYGLKDANLKLLEADRLKSIFLASMSHELRTPLNTIIGFTGILLMEMVGELNAEQKKQLTFVKESAGSLLNLINDLLDISKIEAGRIEVSIEQFQLNQLVGDIIGSFAPQLKGKNVSLTTDLQEIKLSSDIKRVRQILLNLVSNAVKFTEKGSISITSSLHNDDMLQISVSDTGIGIEESELDRLFLPFLQIDSSLTKRYDGSGLGLYLTKKLVTLLKGTISVVSEFGKGSVFSFTLPLNFNKESTINN